MQRRNKSRQPSFHKAKISNQDRNNSLPIVEAGGIPKPAVNEDLRRKFARRLGIERPIPNLDTPDRFTEINLGNPELPVAQFKQDIVDSIAVNPVTIIVAETGAGKSTQVPQYLLEEGYRVVMTQPRRLAAKMLSEQIARELGDDEKLGSDASGLVGYHTAESNTLTEDTRVRVVTDGLLLAQQTANVQADPLEVIIGDEVHEWNKNIEIEIAWMKQSLREDPSRRIVLMSATMEADKLANYFSDVVNRPPIIEVPGRTNQIDKYELDNSTVADEAVKYAAEGKTVLVFLPGLREIDDQINVIYKMLDTQQIEGVTVMPLHGNMSAQQQAQVEQAYTGPKIICATNVAQTSITIPDVDVVVDSCLERRMEIDYNGVDSLRLNYISQADRDQRAGRCGRTKPGIYIATKMTEDSEFVPYLNSPKYPIPEILRTNIHKSTLMVAANGLDISELDLFHPVNSDSIERSRYHLRLLGAFDENNQITQRGRRMNQFPTRPSLARMLTYAEEQNYTAEIKAYMAAIVSSIEVGDLPDYMAGDDWRSLSRRRDSDFLSQLDMFIWTQGTTKHYDLRGAGLNVRHVERAKEAYAKLCSRMQIQPIALKPELSAEQAEQLKDCVLAGMVDFVYESRGPDYVDALGRYKEERTISDRSKVGGKALLIVGTPYKIPPHGTYTDEKHIVQHVNKITKQDLGRVAANLCSWEKTGAIVWRGGNPMEQYERTFRGKVPLGEWREDAAGWTPELRKEVIELYKKSPGPAYRDLLNIKRRLENLWHMTGKIDRITQKHVDDLVEKAASGKIKSPGQLDGRLRNLLVKENISLDRFISPEQEAAIEERCPSSIEIGEYSLQLRYRNGRPSIAHPDAYKPLLLDLPGSLRLEDGRDIFISHDKRMYTIEDFRNVVR